MNRLRRSGNAPSAAKAFAQYISQVRRAEELGMDTRKFIEQYEPKSGASADDTYKAAFRARDAVRRYEREVITQKMAHLATQNLDPWARTDRS